MRQRLSDEEKKIRGTYQPCRSLQADTDAGRLSLDAPGYLSADEGRIWQELVAKAPSGTLKESDEFYLATIARLEAEYRATGTAMPASKVGLLLKALGKAGLNPADRANVPVVEQETTNFDEW